MDTEVKTADALVSSLGKINFSLLLGAVSCAPGQVVSQDKLPESQVPVSETSMQYTELLKKHSGEEKMSHSCE